MSRHSLLDRQLRRHFGAEIPSSPAMEKFLEAVSQAYQSSDADRGLLQHSLETSSRELKERYVQLKRDVEARQLAENQRDAFFRTSADLLCIVNAQLQILQVNHSWCERLGYQPKDLEGKSFLDLVHPSDVDATVSEAKKLKERSAIGGFENRLRTKDGSFRRVSWNVTADHARNLSFAVGRDVTEQRQMERELAQSQKLEAVGQLASGVAHEINTPVQFIGDNVQFLANSFKDLEPLFERLSQQGGDDVKAADLDYLREEIPKSLQEAREGVQRVAELVKALKEYAHADSPEMAPSDVNQAIQRTLVLARSELKHVAEIETDLAELPSVECHIGSLQQVFLNLLVNAAHAIEEKQKAASSTRMGGIKVRTRVDGGEVVIAIQDDGCGIPQAIRHRMFEPFFTTKPMGKGSGQGLPLVRSVVVDRHAGRVELDSEPGVGTTFTLHLPIGQRRAA
ncbi:MAG: ATP-binding protein [Myxococcaceae bacterium]